MGKKILCPYCYQHFDNNEIEVECSNDGKNSRGEEDCPKIVNGKLSDHWGNNSESHFIFKPKLGILSALFPYKPKSEICPKCGFPSQRFVCPHCNNWLPKEMVEKGAEVISVIGGPASGKSNYIVTLIHQLKKYGNKLGLSVMLQQVGRREDEWTYNKYEKARKVIFEMKMPLPKTAVTKHEIPWIMRLESVATGKAVYLVFYDTAGENFKDPDSIRRNAQYLRESKAVICVLDTLSVKRIQKLLESNNIENNDITTPFDETLTALFNFQTGDKNLSDKPFAFVMSKFDVVIDHHEDLGCDVSMFLNEDGSPRNSDFIKTGKLNLSQMEAAHKAIKNYMDDAEIWDESEHCFNIVSKWGKNAQFFGVSSFGCMPDENAMLAGDVDGEIKPYRVMDPLVWALYKVGGFFKA